MFTFKFEVGRDKNNANQPDKAVNKSSTFLVDRNADPNQPDSFYTSLINLGQLQNSLDLLLYFFNNVSEINSIITYIAQKGADIPRKHVKVLGNGKEKDLGETELIRNLKNPNHLNDGRVFMINCISSYLVYGFIPINKIKSIGWDSMQFYLLPGNSFYPITDKSINIYGLPAYGTDFRSNNINKYRMFIDQKPYDLTPEEIILINDSNLSFANGSYLTGQSRLYSAIRSIRTLDYIYDTLNTLIANKGAAGFITKRSKAGEQDTQWWGPESDDRKEVMKQLYSYGTTGGRKPIGVSTADLGFVRLSVPLNEFMPIEIKQHEFRTLATALIFPSVLLNDKEGSIYNNVSLAQKAFYTDCLQPIVNVYYEALTNGCGLAEKSEALRADWSKVECLQADKKLQAETQKAINDLYKGLWDDNLVTRNEWLIALGLPAVSDSEYNKRRNELTPEKQDEIINTDQNATN